MTLLSLVRPIRNFHLTSSNLSRPDNPAVPSEKPACLEKKPVAHPTQFVEREGVGLGHPAPMSGKNHRSGAWAIRKQPVAAPQI